MKKPKKRAAKREKKIDVAQPAESAFQVNTIPDWVDFEPLADFRLIAWDSDEKSLEILLTSYEFVVLRNRLAEMRGYVAKEVAHA